jgi:cytochrome c biogenesis protein CcmG/thiol:disulfide interchange protein DsbE
MARGLVNKNKFLVYTAAILGLALCLTSGLHIVQHRWRVWRTEHGTLQTLAPGFVVTDLSGRDLDLHQYRGKVVLLDLWATWCPACRAEIPGLIDVGERYRDRGLVIVGLSLDDDPAVVQRFYRQYHMTYPVALVNPRTEELYAGVLGIPGSRLVGQAQVPTSILIGRDGRIRSICVGQRDLLPLESEIKELLLQTTAET